MDVTQIVPTGTEHTIILDHELPWQVKKHLREHQVQVPTKNPYVPLLRQESGVVGRIAMVNDRYNLIYLVDTHGFAWKFHWNQESLKWGFVTANDLELWRKTA